MPSKSKKSGLVRPANQPSLFSFWATKKETTNSNETNTVVVKDTSYHKKRRLEKQIINVNLQVSSPETKAIKNEQQTAITPEEPSICTTKCITPNAENTENECKLNREDQKSNSSAANDGLWTATVSSNDAASIEEPDVVQEDNSNDDSDTNSDDEASPLPPTATNPQGLSDYELLRLRNIARNNARLEALGLLTSADTAKLAPKKKSKRPAKRPAKSTAAASLPKRRSSRLSNPKRNDSTSQTRNLNCNNTEENSQPPEPMVEEVEEVDQYEVSPVVQYEMEQKQTTKRQQTKQATATSNNGEQTSKKTASSATTYARDETASLVPCDYRLAPSQGLSAIYSLNFYQDTPWVVGAGKSGIVALWNYQRGDTDDQDGNSEDPTFIDPVFTWKGHSGRWISEAQFLPSGDSTNSQQTPKHLVTAANDSTVCLWDLSQVSTTTGIPKLQQQSNKSWHASGIFAMDVNHSDGGTNKIATASKDKSVAIADIDSGNFTPTWRSNFHQGKVGAVRFRNDHVLASASDDGCVAILDDRMKGETSLPAATLEDLHGGRPHSVVWYSSTSHAFLTAGLDSVIQQWDLRKLKAKEPMCEYVGHVPTSTRRCKRIHHPVFYGGGTFGDNGVRLVLTGGEGSHSLSMFQFQGASMVEGSPCVRSAVYSRGTLPNDCCHTDVGSIAVQQCLVAATVEGQVLLLEPGSA